MGVESLEERLDREAREVMKRAWRTLAEEGDCQCSHCLSTEATTALRNAGLLLCRDVREIDGHAERSDGGQDAR